MSKWIHSLVCVAYLSRCVSRYLTRWMTHGKQDNPRCADQSILQKMAAWVLAWILEVWMIFWSLVKITIPILLLVRFIELMGWIEWLALSIVPLMSWVGLPGEMGLVWVTGMVSSLYTAMVIFYQLGGSETLTIAQVSVLGTMLLISHALPVEGAIAKAAGVSMWFTLLLRIGGGLLLGMILHVIYSRFDLLQTPITAIWQPGEIQSDWMSWFLLQAQTLLAALLIISALTLLIHFLRFVGIEKGIHFLLSPVLRLLGISTKASNIIIVGFTLGITLGGGILIREVRSGNIHSKDVFISMAFLGLCHSLIEDTLLILLLGADLSAILWARVVFSLLFVALLSRALDKLPERHHGYLYRCKAVSQ